MSGLSNISCDAYNTGLDVSKPVKPKLTICTILDTSVSAIDIKKNFMSLGPEAGRALYYCKYVQWFPTNTSDAIHLSREWLRWFRKTEQFVHIRRAGLWIKLFFNIKDKIIEVSIEPKIQQEKQKKTQQKQNIIAQNTAIELTLGYIRPPIQPLFHLFL